MSKIYNRQDMINSEQVSKLVDVPAGDTTYTEYGLLKNITDDNVTVTVIMAGDKSEVSTVLLPGWNPELVYGVKGATADTLQFGF